MHIALILGIGVVCQVVAVIGFGGVPHATWQLSEIKATPITTYNQQVHLLDGWIANLIARTQRDPRSWLALESLADTYRERALFTGTSLDLTRAEDAMTQSFTVAGPGAGPYLSRARLHATLHRFSAAEADLNLAEGEISLDVRDAAGIAALRATIAYQNGHYALAFAAWERSLALFPTPSTYVALADALASTGESLAAAELLLRARLLTNEHDPRTAAWVTVQQGIFEMERGRWDEAAALFRSAERVLPGWWFTATRQADLLARRGEHATAVELYTNLVQRTGKPELMDALATELRLVEKNAAADRWSAIAGLAYDDLLQSQPEAAYGHALDHFLSTASEPTRLVAIAESNYRLRPGGEATMKLAQAYFISGRLTEAVTTIKKVLASPYSTVAVHRLAARIYLANGDLVHANEETGRAWEIDSHD